MTRCRQLAAGTIAMLALALAACGDPGGTGAWPSGPRQPKSTADLVASATLVQCPGATTESATAVVGSLGGTLSVGGTTVLIPQGAILLPTTLTLTVPASPYMEIDVTADGTNGFVFQVPVTVRVDYSRCGTSLDADALSVWYIDSDTKSLRQDMGGADDKLTHSITFTTGHLSGYAVAN